MEVSYARIANKKMPDFLYLKLPKHLHNEIPNNCIAKILIYTFIIDSSILVEIC